MANVLHWFTEVTREELANYHEVTDMSLLLRTGYGFWP
jgi:hypothetical protein